MMILSTTLQPLLLPLVSVFLFVCSSPLAGSSPVESPSTGTPHYPNTMKIPAGVPSPQELIRWASKAPSRGDGERLRWSSGAPTHHDHDRYATSMSNFDDLSKEVPSQWHTTTEADRRHPARPKQFQLLAGDDAPYYLRNKTLRIDPETFHIRFFTMGKILRVHFAHDLDNGKLLVDNFPVSDLELAGLPNRDASFYHAGHELKVTTPAREKRHDLKTVWTLETFKLPVFCVTGINDHLWYGGKCSAVAGWGGSSPFSLKVEYL
ncbi:hypothetical protein EX30DRAFT_367426 [Ascodesmis nigricans]|uniref:Uncharacterized protein n=1 Tax=Ascodesmis nigricans TaxID=341454 RepID=A0A4S2MHQ7_9PEZI|nr:hypothetical protein EX30DRAFT_367426 [Ascodesmis nigricans]